MFFHLLFIHLFRPFLKYNPTTSPLPSHVSPRKICTQAAASISKLFRLYKRTYGLRQICNVAVYILHSACTLHLLNLPDKTAKRDIIHGVKHLEEIAQDWLCARRTLSILSVLARKWNIKLPDDASLVFSRTDSKYGTFSTADIPSPKADLIIQTPPKIPSPSQIPLQTSHSSNGTQFQTHVEHTHYGLPKGKPAAIQSYQNTYAPTLALQQVNTQVPYSLQTFNTPSTRTMTPVDGPRSDHGVTYGATASDTLNRQVSPGAMFGGVDALVDSQDWWLRDQANLAIGFDNWEMAGMNGNGTSSDVDPMAGFYMPLAGDRGSDIYGEEDWTGFSQKSG